MNSEKKNEVIQVGSDCKRSVFVVNILGYEV